MHSPSIIVLESWKGVSVQITGPSPPRPPLRDLLTSYSGNNNQAGNIMPCLGSAGGRAPSEGGGASSEHWSDVRPQTPVASVQPRTQSRNIGLLLRHKCGIKIQSEGGVRLITIERGLLSRLFRKSCRRLLLFIMRRVHKLVS